MKMNQINVEFEKTYQLIKNKVSEITQNSKNKSYSTNVVSVNISNLTEIVELLEKKLDKKNKYNGDFDLNDQNFQNYLFDLLKEYHGLVFGEKSFKKKCLDVLNDIDGSINEMKIENVKPLEKEIKNIHRKLDLIDLFV
jgi:hypothetical protein